VSAHLDVEQLADLSAGLLGGRARAQAQFHLETCEHCRTEAAELAGVSRTLRGAAEKGSMPADVADRLDFALRSEQASTLASGVTALPRPATRRWWADHRVLQAAAAAVLVVAGGAIAVPLLDRAGNAPMTASESAGGNGGEEGAAAPKAADGGKSGDTAAGSGGVLETGTNYSEQTLAADVTRLLSAVEAGRSPPQDLSAGEAAPPPAATRLADPQALAECLTQLRPGKEAAPLLVDVARFEGRRATVIVLPRPDEPERIDIWVVEPGCRNGNSHALHYDSAPRP
jgi:hypothetical protein